MTRHQYGISGLTSQTSFRGDTSADVTKCRLFSQAKKLSCFTSGIIPHSARPPSTNQSHARLTFVAKVSVDEFVGRQKAFTEEMRHFMGVLDTRKSLNSMEQGKGNTIIRIIKCQLP